MSTKSISKLYSEGKYNQAKIIIEYFRERGE
jgi:hypothetical protein